MTSSSDNSINNHDTPPSSLSLSLSSSFQHEPPNAGPSSATSSKKQKPRYSRQQKRDHKAQQEKNHDSTSIFNQNPNQNSHGGPNNGGNPNMPRPKTTSTTANHLNSSNPRNHYPNTQTTTSNNNNNNNNNNKEKKSAFGTMSWQDRILQCIQDARHTESILAIEDHQRRCRPSAPEASSSLPAMNNDNVDRIRVVSTCHLETSRDLFPVTISSSYHPLTVRVRPLLILDLNGILCHRSRKQKEPAGVQLRRPFLGTVAGTPVVGRTDLMSFLHLVDHHFCLAVWTSAKLKTARGLLQMLVPPEIQRRLLFVWAQQDCHLVFPTKHRNDNGNDRHEKKDSNGDNDYNEESSCKQFKVHGGDIIFEKHLDKVWQRYPLWNANNTLLIDDSPDKCPVAQGNAIHPPPLHGQWCPPRRPAVQGDDGSNHNSNYQPESVTTWIADEHNEQAQYQFFQRYIAHWHKFPYAEDLTQATVPTFSSSKKLPNIVQEQEQQQQQQQQQLLLLPQQMPDTAIEETVPPSPGAVIVPAREQITNPSLYAFLRIHGTGHMGWRGDPGVQDSADQQEKPLGGNTDGSLTNHQTPPQGGGATAVPMEEG